VTTVATLPVNGLYPDDLMMRTQITAWKPAAVVAVTSLHSAFGRYLTGLLGRPTVTSGAVLGWRFRH
jgi:hypothetical protein